jgi:hypothetical protein
MKGVPMFASFLGMVVGMVSVSDVEWRVVVGVENFVIFVSSYIPLYCPPGLRA